VVVDDEKVVRDYIKMVLKENGFRVITAMNSRRFLESQQGISEKIKLVILDRTIPGEDSIQMAMHFHKKFEEIPVLLTSGYSVDEKTEALLDNEWVSFLPKPFQLFELLAAIDKLMGV